MLIEVLLATKLNEAMFSSNAWVLGVGYAIMIVPGYYGKLVITDDLTPHCVCWFASMAFFLNIMYKLLVGLSCYSK